MDNFGGNFFNSYNNNSTRETEGSQYFDPYFVKHRKRTTKAQLKVLEETFETNIRPDANMRKKLGEELGMTPRSVQVWFQNRRAKIKKLTQKKMMQQENTDNTKGQETAHTPSPSKESKYNGYHPYMPIQGPLEEFNVYPRDNSIYKHAIPQGMGSPVMYEGFGYRGHEEYGYPYVQRYGNGEYYQMQYPYGMMQAQWHQPPGFRDEDYYRSTRKQQYRGGAPNPEKM
ncbi:Homeodomain-containing transcription factor-like protein [Encephalitozoon intestinalis ATCC 50506]|uniref:Homeodomain-containing transcription factor-like protein n=1 Tax=Encephalitozoon intestinalis (strain ATCC 50506) TaxID=876142 RepID=E0S6B5_ENCIT|nr:Homeodomain-containing transcription factor-like protein [Encephalitozoon intestinalis ATCC 50506]ADM11250.1 Homeodomain-containing transcription factor-like protein [Encephalitozoon intestinalis ATCC 50506]UTX44919.1 homeobox domain-containing protein [Encephalitozoon intestinalis]